MVAGLREGVGVVRRDRGLAALVAFGSVLLFTYGMEQVLHVFVAVDRLGLGPEGVGIMGAAIGVGGLVVAPLTARLARSGRAGWFLIGSGIGVGLPLVALSLTRSTALALAVLAVEGAATIVNEVLLLTLLQRSCPDELLGRLYGLQDSSMSLCQLLGSLLAPLAVGAFGLGFGLWVGGGVAVGVSLLLAPAVLALASRAESRRQALRPLVARLRHLSLFADTGEAALERLAAAASPVAVGPGEAVLREGEAPVDLYVVDSGELVVRSRGEGGTEREVNRMGPDDWFGEIGLLHGVPRTATVEAVTACRLVRIPGEVFLSSLAAPDVLPDPVRRTMAARLARTHPTTLGAV